MAGLALAAFRLGDKQRALVELDRAQALGEREVRVLLFVVGRTTEQVQVA